MDDSSDQDSLAKELRVLHQELQQLRGEIGIVSALPEELARLRRDMSRLEHALSETARNPALLHSEPPLRLSFFFDTIGGERKPYLMKMDGIMSSSQRLSAIRSAIMVVLLLDLQDRLEEGRGVLEPVEAVAEALRLLEPESIQEKQLANNIRVALYRFDLFCKANNYFGNQDYSLYYRAEESRFEIRGRDGRPINRPVQLQITTNTAAIATLIDRTLATSPLARARKRKAVHVPSGAEGFDRLFFEFYDHSYPMEVVSLYFRLSFSNYPLELLERLGMSERVKERKRAVFRALEDERLQFTEVLNQKVLWDLIRRGTEGGFVHYPPHIETEHVLEHLEHLIYMLKTFEGYHLVLTDAIIPFFLASYEIKSGAVPEYFTVFLTRLNQAQHQHDVSCFVVTDANVHQSVSEHIVNWIMSHPSTMRSRERVIEELEEVRNHLREEGPLPPAVVSLL